MKIALFFLPLALLAGCTNIKETLGIQKTAADSFSVNPNPPLEIPPHINQFFETPKESNTVPNQQPLDPVEEKLLQSLNKPSSP